MKSVRLFIANFLICLGVLTFVQAWPVTGQPVLAVQLTGSDEDAPRSLFAAVAHADGQILAATPWGRAWIVRSDANSFLSQLGRTSGVLVLRAPVSGTC